MKNAASMTRTDRQLEQVRIGLADAWNVVRTSRSHAAVAHAMNRIARLEKTRKIVLAAA